MVTSVIARAPVAHSPHTNRRKADVAAFMALKMKDVKFGLHSETITIANNYQHFFGKAREVTMTSWPEIADADIRSMHAIGVVSVRFNRLEQVLWMLVAHFTSIRLDIAHYLVNKMKNEYLFELLRKLSDARHDSAEIAEPLHHFLKCAAICEKNRNLLMHSNISLNENGTSHLWKVSQTDIGKITKVDCKTSSIRDIADEIELAAELGNQILIKLNFSNAPRDMLPEALLKMIEAPFKIPNLPTDRSRNAISKC